MHAESRSYMVNETALSEDEVEYSTSDEEGEDEDDHGHGHDSEDDDDDGTNDDLNSKWDINPLFSLSLK